MSLAKSDFSGHVSSGKDTSPTEERARPHSAQGRMSTGGGGGGGGLSGGAVRVDQHAHAERGRPASAMAGETMCLYVCIVCVCVYLVCKCMYVCIDIGRHAHT